MYVLLFPKYEWEARLVTHPNNLFGYTNKYGTKDQGLNTGFSTQFQILYSFKYDLIRGIRGGKIEVIVTGINVILNLEIGEIKRSESNDIIKHGFVQLCWRLAVIGYALDILFPNIKCTLVGNLFSPRTDKKFTPECDDAFIYTNKDKGFNYFIRHIFI
ncbi:unnamed protein product [Rhizophagus irregularis]|nr:unnamed protein product [Rhizophagus irregularis]